MKSLLAISLFVGLSQVSAQPSPTVVYLNECTEVARKPLTPEQIAAWQDLQAAEKRMTFLQQPLEEMQQKLKGPEQKLQQVSPPTTRVETEQVKQYSEEIRDVIDIYQKDIDRLHAYSKELTAKAKTFSGFIKAMAPTTPYQQVQIVNHATDPVDCSDKVIMAESRF